MDIFTAYWDYNSSLKSFKFTSHFKDMALHLKFLSCYRSALCRVPFALCSSAVPENKFQSSNLFKQKLINAKEIASTKVRTAGDRSYYVDLKEVHVGDAIQNFVKLSEVSKQKRSTIFLGARDLVKVLHCIDGADLSSEGDEEQTLNISFESEDFENKTYGISFQKYYGRTDIVICESFEAHGMPRKTFIYVEIATVKNISDALKTIMNKGK